MSQTNDLQFYVQFIKTYLQLKLKCSNNVWIAGTVWHQNSVLLLNVPNKEYIYNFCTQLNKNTLKIKLLNVVRFIVHSNAENIGFISRNLASVEKDGSLALFEFLHNI